MDKNIKGYLPLSAKPWLGILGYVLFVAAWVAATLYYYAWISPKMTSYDDRLIVVCGVLITIVVTYTFWKLSLCEEAIAYGRRFWRNNVVGHDLAVCSAKTMPPDLHEVWHYRGGVHWMVLKPGEKPGGLASSSKVPVIVYPLGGWRRRVGRVWWWNGPETKFDGQVVGWTIERVGTADEDVGFQELILCDHKDQGVRFSVTSALEFFEWYFRSSPSGFDWRFKIQELLECDRERHELWLALEKTRKEERTRLEEAVRRLDATKRAIRSKEVAAVRAWLAEELAKLGAEDAGADHAA